MHVVRRQPCRRQHRDDQKENYRELAEHAEEGKSEK
jgi:hypothetical protein